MTNGLSSWVIEIIGIDLVVVVVVGHHVYTYTYTHVYIYICICMVSLIMHHRLLLIGLTIINRWLSIWWWWWCIQLAVCKLSNTTLIRCWMCVCYNIRSNLYGAFEVKWSRVCSMVVADEIIKTPRWACDNILLSYSSCWCLSVSYSSSTILTIAYDPMIQWSNDDIQMIKIVMLMILI